MGRDTDEESLKVFQRIEKEVQTCVVSNATGLPDHINLLLSSFCCAGQDAILQNFELAKREKVENRLWDIHGKINSHFRKQFKIFREAGGQRKAVEQRVLERRFLEFIKSSQRFYRGFIQSLGSRFEGVKQLEAVANRLTLSTLSVEEPAPATGELERLLLLSCHQTLIRLGDLSRWRETQLETKDRNWGPAIGYYDLAGRIYPASGAPHNQLAVIALQDSSHLDAVYHLYLALTVEEPHPNAKDNLEVEFKKIEELWIKGGVLRRKNASYSQEAANDIAALFLYLHAYYYKGKKSLELDELERKALNELAVALKERSIDKILCKVVLVNIGAEYFAVQRLRNNHESSGTLQSFVSLQRLNLGTFSTLLQLLEQELERHFGNEAVAKGPHKVGYTKRGPAKISVVARRVFPALRHYSSWLLANSTILMANNDEAISAQVRVLWRAYAKVLTLLAFMFSWDELNASAWDYLLDEDEITLGFTPFKHESVKRRYLKDDGVTQKPRHHESDSSVQRHHHKKEMLGRVRDLLVDGNIIQNREGTPITLVNESGRFVYLEGNEFSELIGQARFPSTAAQSEEMTHINETSFSHTASEAASGLTPMDVDSKRIVDDLVDSEVEGERDTIDYVIKRVTQSGQQNGEDTSYGLIESATVRDHFGEQPIGARRLSRPFLPSIEKSPFVPQPDEEQILASPQRPIYRKLQPPSGKAHEILPSLDQHSKYIRVSSSNSSSMPTPTFQNTQPDRFSAAAGHQDPSVRVRDVQKVLDERVFRSSNVFPGSAPGNTQAS